MRFRRCAALLVMLLAPLVLAACGAGGQNPEPEVTTLIYANLSKGDSESRVDQGAVTVFNNTHKNVKIEVRNYFDEDGLDGRKKLFTDIATGNMPDIIDLTPSGGMPYQQLVHKGYLEDLWPYIENDPDLGPENLLEAPIEAAKVDGGLYAVFREVCIWTLVGQKSVVGDRYSWTLEDLMDCFDSMPDDASILGQYTTKEEIFPYMFRMSLDSYVDWNTGECSFDSVGFRTALEFINAFPNEYPPNYWNLTFEDRYEQDVERLLNGKQMLMTSYTGASSIVRGYDTVLGQGEPVSFIGYPTGDGSVGSFFVFCGPVLGMSSYCKDKEAAWEFLRQLLLPQYENMEDLERNLPAIRINRSDYEMTKRYDIRYARDVRFYFGPITVNVEKLTEEEFARYEDLINHIDKTEFYDKNVYDIVYEVATAYFAGDKTLDEAVELIQQRVSLYVNEMR